MESLIQGGDYTDLQEPALLTAGCFVLVALLLSMFLIFQHLRCYTNPPEQKWIAGILLMVPLYATEYPYLALVMNFSQMWALYCLVQFYNVSHEKLRLIRPLAKFISFKAIVFATWWQGVGITLAQSLGDVPREGKIESGLQDFLICIEMSVAAVAHVFVFSSEPYKCVPVSEQPKQELV